LCWSQISKGNNRSLAKPGRRSEQRRNPLHSKFNASKQFDSEIQRKQLALPQLARFSFGQVAM